MGELVVALVDREQPAHREQQDGDDEAPEIAELAVAQRMVFVRWALGLLETQVQQYLVPRIGI